VPYRIAPHTAHCRACYYPLTTYRYRTPPPRTPLAHLPAYSARLRTTPVPPHHASCHYGTTTCLLPPPSIFTLFTQHACLPAYYRAPTHAAARTPRCAARAPLLPHACTWHTISPLPFCHDPCHACPQHITCLVITYNVLPPSPSDHAPAPPTSTPDCPPPREHQTTHFPASPPTTPRLTPHPPHQTYSPPLPRLPPAPTPTTLPLGSHTYYTHIHHTHTLPRPAPAGALPPHFAGATMDLNSARLPHTTLPTAYPTAHTHTTGSRTCPYRGPSDGRTHMHWGLQDPTLHRVPRDPRAGPQWVGQLNLPTQRPGNARLVAGSSAGPTPD